MSLSIDHLVAIGVAFVEFKSTRDDGVTVYRAAPNILEFECAHLPRQRYRLEAGSILRMCMSYNLTYTWTHVTAPNGDVIFDGWPVLYATGKPDQRIPIHPDFPEFLKSPTTVPMQVAVRLIDPEEAPR